MKTPVFLFSLIFLVKMSFSQTIIPPGEVSGIWKKALSPYQIEGDITIPNDSTLTIEPGVEIVFLGHFGLYVQGRLLAIGTKIDTIIFTVSDTTGFHNPDTTLGGWNGIRFIDTPAGNDSSLIIYCKLQYGKAVGNVWHINAGGAVCVIDFDKVRISNSVFRYNTAGGLMESPSGGAVHLHLSDIIFNDNIFSYNYARAGGGAIQLHESSPRFVNNIFSNNRSVRGGAVSIDALSSPTFTNDRFLDNTAESHGGGILTGDPAVVTCTDLELINNSAQWGGGIGVVGGKLYATDCLFSDNKAEYWGGGIAGDYASLYLDKCTFYGDSSGWGSGGVHNDHAYAEISNCDFIGNQAVFGAGYHGVFSEAEFYQCRFISNTAETAAGMHIENASLSVDQCLFDGNYSQNEIGALQVRADSLIWFSLYDLNISNTIFRNNISSGLVAGAQIEQTDTTQSLMNVRLDHCTFTANNAYRVPGLRIIGKIKDFTVSNCLFSENTVTTQNAAAHFLSKCTGRVENCLFIKNSGGANITINIEAEVEFINCTIADNNSDEVAGLSLRRGGKAVLTNTIIRNNCRNEIRLTTAVGLGNEITINHCNIRNGIDSVLVSDSLCLVNWGSGNIDADPLFIDTTVNDYHLQDTSPCIGAGINCLKIDEIWHCAPPYDLDGISRPSPEETNTDMGAYEHPLGLPSAIVITENQIPERSALFQNYPNPFNPSTVITWQVAVGSNVALSIYNVLGEKVTTLVSRRMNAGTYSCTFDGNNLASGVYYYRLDTASFHAVQKMILLR